MQSFGGFSLLFRGDLDGFHCYRFVVDLGLVQLQVGEGLGHPEHRFLLDYYLQLALLLLSLFLV